MSTIEAKSRTQRGVESQTNRERKNGATSGKPVASKRADVPSHPPARDNSNAPNKVKEENNKAHGFIGGGAGVALAPKLEMTPSPPVANFGDVGSAIGNAVTNAATHVAASADATFNGLKNAVDHAVGLFDPGKSLPAVPSSMTESVAEKQPSRAPTGSSDNESTLNLFPRQWLTGHNASTGGTDEDGTDDNDDSRVSGNRDEADAGSTRKADDGKSYLVSSSQARPGAAVFVGEEGQVLGNLADLRRGIHRNPKKLIDSMYDYVHVRKHEVSPGFYLGDIGASNLDIDSVVGYLSQWEHGGGKILAEFDHAYGRVRGKKENNAAFSPANPSLTDRVFSAILKKWTFPGVKQQSKPVDIAIEIAALTAPAVMLLTPDPVTFMATIGLMAFSLPNLYSIKFRGRPIYRRP